MCTSAPSPRSSPPSSPGLDYQRMDEAERVRLLLRELVSPRPLFSPFIDYSEETSGRTWRSSSAAANIRKTYGPGAIRTSIISNTDSVSDMLELALLMKEVGLIRPAGTASLASRAAVRDDRGPARLRRRDGSAACDPRIPQARGFARRRAGSDARLFRLQQGRRLRHLGLGALQGRDRAGGGVPPPWRAHPPFPRPRRLGRPRRRPELRRDSRSARRRGAGTDPHHRTGRDHLEQILQPGGRAAQSRDARLGDARGDAAAGREPGARPRLSGDDGGTVAQRLRRLSRPRLRDRGLRALFLGLDRYH